MVMGGRTPFQYGGSGDHWKGRMTEQRRTTRLLGIESWALVLLVLGVYFSRMTALSIRGEESRRARVAYEMLETGDWLVPRVQGVP